MFNCFNDSECIESDSQLEQFADNGKAIVEHERSAGLLNDAKTLGQKLDVLPLQSIAQLVKLKLAHKTKGALGEAKHRW